MASDSECIQLSKSFGTGDQNDQNFLDAANLFCNKILNLTGETNQTDFFGSFCCKNFHIADLCTQFAKHVLNSELNLTCELPNNDFNLKDYDAYTYTLLAICLPLGLFANFLIVYVILRYQCLPRQTSYFLCSLALGDIGVIVEFVCFLIYNKYVDDSDSSRVHTFLIPSFSVLFASVSLLQISVISIERAMAVDKPLIYQRYITTRNSKILVILIWLISCLLFLLSVLRIPVESTKYANFVFYLLASLLLVIPIIIVTFCYGFVLISACRNITRDKEKSKERRLSTVTSVASGRRRSSFSISVLRLKQIRISVNIGIVVIPFLACWGMFTFVHIYEVLTNYQFSGIANWFFLFLPLFVSSTNPIAYLILTKTLRGTLLAILSRQSRLEKPLKMRLPYTPGESTPAMQDLQIGESDIILQRLPRRKCVSIQ